MPIRQNSAGATVEQLDMFAEFEAGETQRRAEQASTLFETAARGYFARIAAFEQWVNDYGHFDSYRRSHAWHAQLGDPRGVSPTYICRPVILCADLRCDCDNDDQGCYCAGGVDLLYRGACLHCTWEGAACEGENAAAEDAHDHSWPGWRELPLAHQPESGTSRKQKEAMARWAAEVNAIYPSGWLESGGPIRTSRTGCGTRHVPDHTGFGGYDI
ncbi:MAG: hypothetical protein QOE41_3611, partial [Mycobacterium sp.]|nr:hypothetical protein [Mycobacterium sp.]